MIIDFKVGDRFLLKHFPHCNQFGEVEVTIYQIDEYDLLIYSDEAASKRLGHNAADYEGGENLPLPEPDNLSGSWWITQDHLRDLIITKLPKEGVVTRHPNWKVIRKIKEMQDRRKKMGYEYV